MADELNAWFVFQVKFNEIFGLGIAREKYFLPST
jgi:hypothetical protein